MEKRKGAPWMNEAIKADVLVLGGGPGGYSAAFHAADLGLKTVLVDERENPGGVCLHEGCIPSKALLHAARVITEVSEANEFGLEFEEPNLDLERLRSWKNKVVLQLTGGLGKLAKARQVRYIQARARFRDARHVIIEDSERTEVEFEHAIVATGSKPALIPGVELEDDRVVDSSGALRLPDVPGRLLVIGGGYIGLELGTVYSALGSRVTVVEMLDGLLPGADRDLVRPLAKRLEQVFEGIHLKTQVERIRTRDKGVEVTFAGSHTGTETFDRVLVSVGRKPNSGNLGLEELGIELTSGGFIKIDEQCRTSVANLFAVGDVAGQPMLAHKAMREGKVAAEVIAGKKTAFDNRAIPAVVFTDPEVAWTGLTETEAKAKGIEVKVLRFPWAASGRALTLGRTEGLTKLICEPESGRILGAGVVGVNAGELIAEPTLAVEMAAVADDVALTIHTHPTLSETMGEVAEMFLGNATHVFRK